MSFVFNGVTIPTDADNIIFNGTIVQAVVFNGQAVWARAGSQTFTSSGTFTVPAGVTSVTVKMVGGGGGGSIVYNASASCGGGYRGTYATGTFAVTPGQQIAVTVGAGGAGGVYQPNNGQPGGASNFGGLLSAAGGAGGLWNSANYPGNGGAYTSPFDGSTKYDGVSNFVEQYRAYGGQASAFGNGGRGGTNTISAGAGGVGAGGGGKITSGTVSAPGGRGEVRVYW